MTAKSLALISGKGGSGKTTIAICIATMLADCGIKVLLVDCDFSTNGATYFYEDIINEREDSIFSFMDIIGYISNVGTVGRQQVIKKLKINTAEYLFISDNYAFIPSIMPSDIRTNHFDGLNVKEYSSKFSSIYEYFKSQFDVIIFDCQAGYSETLEYVLPVSNYTLLVMEADAISSAAVRNLYLKTEAYIKKTKMYQVFSKVTEEEKKIYGQVLLGTFYTNIGAVEFDWNVRRAFAIAEVPDIKNSNSDFGMQIYDICMKIFKSNEMEKALYKYKIIFEYNMLQGKLEKLKPWLERKSDYWLTALSLVLALISLFAAIILLFPEIKSSDVLKTHLSIIMAVPLIVVSSLVFVLVSTIDTKRVKRRREYKEIEADIHSLLLKYPDILEEK